MSKKILLTGGAGYIGSIVASHLLKNGFEVTVFDKCLFGAQALLAFAPLPNFRLICGDVRDPAALQAAMPGHDAVVHLAAIVGEPACAVDPAGAKEINLAGTQAVVSVAQECGVDRFIFISTCSNYGVSAPNALTDEDSPLCPLSLYAESKVAAEQAVLAASEPLHATVLRFGTICGLSPRMRFDLLVSDMARAAARGCPIQIFAPGAWRPFLHVRDAARAIESCLSASLSQVKSKIFNAVGENYQKAGLVDLVLKHFPSSKVEVVDKSPDMRDYRVSAKRIEQELGFTPAYTVEQAFLETADAVKRGIFLDPFWAGYSAIPATVEGKI